MSGFLRSIDLNRAFHDEVVRPLLGDIGYAAGLLGWGSDVLGYDTERSTDHGWGPRLSVFVDAAEIVGVREAMDARLPAEFRGHPVRYGWDDEPLRHHVVVETLPDWLTGHLGLDASRPLSSIDWLLLPQQQLLGVVGGQVYADDGRLAPVRAALAWYPDQVWRWLLACQWRRIAQEEPFVQRTAEVGDDLGSAIVAARQVREVIRLALLLGRRFAPYGKWLGTAFAELDHRDGLDVALRAAVDATDLGTREEALGRAYETIARRHNATGLTAVVDPTLRTFHDRPARVLGADRLVDACLATVTDPALRDLPLVGGVDQLADCTDLLGDPGVYLRIAALFTPSARRATS